MGTIRKEIPQKVIDICFEEAKAEMARRLEQKGYGGFASTHEITGVLEEESREYKDALHDNDIEQFEKELFDLVIGALFGIASIKFRTIDW